MNTSATNTRPRLALGRRARVGFSAATLAIASLLGFGSMPATAAPEPAEQASGTATPDHLQYSEPGPGDHEVSTADTGHVDRGSRGERPKPSADTSTR
ncbi:hypothetical protein [Glutamicibacter sp. PS]|uniref:hypothetical protein n=1 Tax=Glutamicibacter sp. PS TaxID=3075634 RepID=UPI002842583D|nr:hypothetical protein [Glutamicibacter sp. PS]MDR4534055.1 hypothetical protein [Glutamicibacter sp. PS]